MYGTCFSTTCATLAIITLNKPQKGHHNAMKIEAVSNASFVRSVIEHAIKHEYQFEVSWTYTTRTPKVRIAFHKGIYYLCKFEKGKLSDSFYIEDCFALYEAKNPLLDGLIQQQIETHKLSANGSREEVACVIANILEVWCSKFSEVEHIKILQAHRNGTLDSEGNFKQAPEVWT